MRKKRKYSKRPTFREIRWGKFNFKKWYSTCMQIRLKGGFELRSETKMAIYHIGNFIFLYWASANIRENEKNTEIIVDYDGKLFTYIRFYLESGKKADKSLKELEKAIIESKIDHDKIVSGIMKKRGDIFIPLKK